MLYLATDGRVGTNSQVGPRRDRRQTVSPAATPIGYWESSEGSFYVSIDQDTLGVVHTRTDKVERYQLRSGDAELTAAVFCALRKLRSIAQGNTQQRTRLHPHDASPPQKLDESQSDADAASGKPAVLLQHRVIESSFAWVCNYRNESLAFVLADAGYDVWLGNSRGNTYSNESLKYTTDDDEFWDFSWEDMGLYDLPAMINYVQDTSGRAKISYIGHSQGVTQALVGFAANQTLAQSVSYFGALAPVSWLGNSKAELFVALANAHLDLVYQALGIVELLPHNELLTRFLAGYTCTAIDGICGSAISLLFGTTASLNIFHVPVLISQTPAGTSVKDVVHFAQGLYVCAGDTLTEPADLARLRSVLPSGTVVHDQTIDIYSHLDFIWAYNANEYVYQDLLAHVGY
ncbi:unnamed protein product [Phytophthora lilii]|uniref:Unnamed protein product n=1 Tax=Phytophthora lilii TaxID=2077276 RepID=A0A9W6UE95_9STRA|nr:unnamed protein product [Phytophthora lilii]